MITYGHFIGGKHVAGKSGRFADVWQPMDGSLRGKVALASKAEMTEAVANAKRRSRPGRRQSAAARARADEVPELVAKHNDELADILAREHGKTIPDAKGDIQRGVEVVESGAGRPAHAQGRVHRRRRPRHRHLFDAPAARRGGGHHALQLPGHDPDVEARSRHRLRQRLHPQAVGARSRRADAPR